jgi:hypothetical protein
VQPFTGARTEGSRAISLPAVASIDGRANPWRPDGHLATPQAVRKLGWTPRIVHPDLVHRCKTRLFSVCVPNLDEALIARKCNFRTAWPHPRQLACSFILHPSSFILHPSLGPPSPSCLFCSSPTLTRVPRHWLQQVDRPSPGISLVLSASSRAESAFRLPPPATICLFPVPVP